MNRIRCGGRGMTLVEVVVSVALLAILSLMVVTALAASLTAVNTTRRRNNDAMAAVSAVETRRAAGSSDSGGTVTIQNGTMTVTFGGIACEVSGSYICAKSGDVTYKEFVPANAKNGG